MVACGNRNQFPSATEQTMAHYCVTSTIRMRISTEHVSYKTKTRANNSSPGPAGRPQRQLFVIVGQRLAIRFLQLNLHIREHRHVILRRGPSCQQRHLSKHKKKDTLCTLC